jgi:hypothetical protein
MLLLREAGLPNAIAMTVAAQLVLLAMGFVHPVHEGK